MEEVKVQEKMMKYWTSIYRKEYNEMTSEWNNERGREYRNRWCQVSEVGGGISIYIDVDQQLGPGQFGPDN